MSRRQWLPVPDGKLKKAALGASPKPVRLGVSAEALGWAGLGWTCRQLRKGSTNGPRSPGTSPKVPDLSALDHAQF